MNMFVFYLPLDLLDLRMLLGLFVLGHVSFVWLLAGYFWDLCVCYLSFLHLGMSVVCLLVHLGFRFRFLILGFCFVFI